MAEKPRFNVGAACRRLGIGPHTLRAWESRYAAVRPERSGTGRRVYSGVEIERLEKLVRLVNLGHSIGDVASLPDGELDTLIHQSSAPRVPSREEPSEALLGALRPALERFDVHAIAGLLDQRRNALGMRAFVLEVLLPLLRWTGTVVADGRLSVAHEHALSAILRDQIHQSLRYGKPAAPAASAPRFVLATPEDDLHEFGILIASALIAHHGFSCHFLGANLPADALAIAAKAVDGNVVLLGNSPAPPEERPISFDAYLASLHRALPENVEIWIGGDGAVPHLRRVAPGRYCRMLASMEELDALLAKLGP